MKKLFLLVLCFFWVAGSAQAGAGGNSAKQDEQLRQAGKSSIYFYDIRATDNHGSAKLVINTDKHTFVCIGQDFMPNQQVYLQYTTDGGSIVFATGKTTPSGNLHIAGAWESGSVPSVVGITFGLTQDRDRGLLLAVGIFGAGSGATIPFTGVLSQDATNHYSLSFAVNGINAQVALANFVLTEGTPLAENSSTPVTVTFPPRDGDLIKISAQTDYLNFSVTASSFTGTGNVDMDNGSIYADPYYPLDADMIVCIDSGGCYLFTTINGVFTTPVDQMLVSGKCGLYLGLPWGTGLVVDVLVWGGEALWVSY